MHFFDILQSSFYDIFMTDVQVIRTTNPWNTNFIHLQFKPLLFILKWEFFSRFCAHILQMINSFSYKTVKSTNSSNLSILLVDAVFSQVALLFSSTFLIQICLDPLALKFEPTPALNLKTLDFVTWDDQVIRI